MFTPFATSSYLCGGIWCVCVWLMYASKYGSGFAFKDCQTNTNELDRLDTTNTNNTQHSIHFATFATSRSGVLVPRPSTHKPHQVVWWANFSSVILPCQ